MKTPRTRAAVMSPAWYRFASRIGDDSRARGREHAPAGGCPITPIWAVTAGNLLFQAGRCGQVMRR